MFVRFFCIIVFLLCWTSSYVFPRSNVNYLRNRFSKIKKSSNRVVPLDDLFEQLEEANKTGDSNSVLRICDKICKDYKSEDISSGAYFLRGVIYEESRQYRYAIKMFTKVVKNYPESQWFSLSIEKYFQIAQKLQSGTRPKYFGVVPGLRDYNAAISDYELVVKYAPYSSYAPKALIEIANLHISAKNYDLAIDALDRIIDLYSDSVEVAYAYLKIAEIYTNLVKGEEYNQGGALTALRYYKEFILLFPFHDEVKLAQTMIQKLEDDIVKSKISLGDFYFNAKYNANAAKKLYNLAIDFAPYTLSADVARSRINEIDNGKLPKETPVDFLFSKYLFPVGQLVCNDEFVSSAKVHDRAMDKIDNRVDCASEKVEDGFISSEDIRGDNKNEEKCCCE